MKQSILTLIALSIAISPTFAGLLGDCSNKRFSRELEFDIMYHCVSSINLMDRNEYKTKIEACACYVGSLACEFDGSDEKLIKTAELGKKLENNDKKYNQCSEKETSIDRSAMKKTAKKAIDDAD